MKLAELSGGSYGCMLSRSRLSLDQSLSTRGRCPINAFSARFLGDKPECSEAGQGTAPILTLFLVCTGTVTGSGLR